MTNAKFKIVLSNNKFAVLDQICALKRRINIFQVLDYKGQDLSYIANITQGKDTFINVLAVLEDQQTVVPYKPIAINAPLVASNRIDITILFLAIIMAILITCLLYFYIKNKRLQSRLDREI